MTFVDSPDHFSPCYIPEQQTAYIAELLLLRRVRFLDQVYLALLLNKYCLRAHNAQPTYIEQKNLPVEIFTVHPGPTTTDLNGNMDLPGFHNIETIGEKMAELINDGKKHNGEFIELYPIVKED